MGAPHGSNKSACLMGALLSCYHPRHAISMSCTVVVSVCNNPQAESLDCSQLCSVASLIVHVSGLVILKSHSCCAAAFLGLCFCLTGCVYKLSNRNRSWLPSRRRSLASACMAQQAGLQPLACHRLLPSHQYRSATTCLAACVCLWQ